VTLHLFLGAPEGLPAVLVVVATYLMPSSIALWLQADARARGRSPAYDFDSLIFFLWLFVTPIYLFRTRGWNAFGPIALFLGLFLGAYLFALLLGYPHSLDFVHQRASHLTR
jgi:hypothetical protein